MERTQPKKVHTSFLKRYKLLYHINYLSSIENTFNCGAIYHISKIIIICGRVEGERGRMGEGERGRWGD
jgi:hypothetical protein